jgi:hypothetical protein
MDHHVIYIRSHFGSSHFFCSRLSSIHIAFRAGMDRLDRSIEADPPLDPRSNFILVELQKQQLDKIAAVDAACRSCGVNPQLSYISAQDSRSLTGQITVSAAFERFPGEDGGSLSASSLDTVYMKIFRATPRCPIDKNIKDDDQDIKDDGRDTNKHDQDSNKDQEDNQKKDQEEKDSQVTTKVDVNDESPLDKKRRLLGNAIGEVNIKNPPFHTFYANGAKCEDPHLVEVCPGFPDIVAVPEGVENLAKWGQNRGRIRQAQVDGQHVRRAPGDYFTNVLQEYVAQGPEGHHHLWPVHRLSLVRGSGQRVQLRAP